MATLKISDLSVGDWVEFKGELCKVLECGAIIVSPRTIEFKPRLILSAKYDIYDCVDVDKVRPIPITAEILEKNGFVRCSAEFNIYEYTTLLGKILRTTQVHLITSQSISVFLHDTSIERGSYHREKTQVYILRDELYVHDIQHALRLAGVDKEINL